MKATKWKMLEGWFTPQLMNRYGKGWDVDRHPVGTYRISMDDKVDVLGIARVWLSRTDQDYQCMFGDVDLADGVFELETYKIGRGVSLAWPPKGSRVNFEVMYMPK